MAKFRDNVETGGGGEFIRLKDKESVYVIFMGEPYEFLSLWKDGTYQSVPEGTPKGKFRFRMNAVVKEADGTYAPKIFEQGATIYNTLKVLNDEYQGLDTVIVKITRQGSSMNDTEYQILPLRQEIPPATRSALSKIKLLKLEHGKQPSNSVDPSFGKPPEEFQDDAELPF